MNSAELISFVRQNRNDIEQARYMFMQLYKSQRFNSDEVIQGLSALRNRIICLFNSIPRSLGQLDDGSTESYGFSEWYYRYTKKTFPNKKNFLQFLESILEQMITLEQFQTEIVTIDAARIKGDVKKFQELWRTTDQMLLLLIDALQSLETAARKELPGEEESKKQQITKILITDIQPLIANHGETIIIIQRNVKDNREAETGVIGELTDEGKRIAENISHDFFNTVFQVLKEEKNTVDVRVVASSATLILPGGLRADKKRAVDTADYMIAGLLKSMDSYQVSKSQLLTSRPIELSELHDLFITDRFPGFISFLIDKSKGNMKDFWIRYEGDQHENVTRKAGIEGQNQIADRIYDVVAAQVKFSLEYHKIHPGRRLYIWIVGHYDSLSPFLKKHVFNTDITIYLQMEQGGGVVIKCNNGGHMECIFRNHNWVIR
jgi:hypothetical protein